MSEGQESEQGDMLIPASAAQQRLWFLYQLDTDDTSYNMSQAFRLRSHLNKVALCETLNRIVARHAALRTTFAIHEHLPMQQVHNVLRIELSLIKISETEVDSLDYLENQRSTEDFVIMGICTSADNAHRAMREDERVVGAVCVDGYSYATLRYYTNHYLPKLLSLKSWRNLLKRMFRWFDSSRLSDDESAEDDQLNYRWKLPPKDQTESDYQEFISRGSKLLCIFTGGWRCNYSGQLADSLSSLEFGDTISVEYLPDATHTFKVEEDREMLISTIIPWLKSNWGSD